ncbi:MAG: hypothetical protein HY658_09130 [Actinobacteria bacterium]|nr:hypothetical protein [Actinomycetota bacterium]
MGVFVVPHSVGVRDATVWVGWWSDDVRPLLDLVLLDERAGEVDRIELAGSWRVVGRHSDEAPSCRFRWETFTDLGGNTRYFCHLRRRATGETVASATFETLPIQLVPSSERSRRRDRRAFTMLLGSCFWDEVDDGKAGRAYQEIYRGPFAPHVKLLVGDQVYVDQPPWAWVLPIFDRGEMIERVTARYARSWEKLHPLLRQGSNVFSSDDHEYWNDYPFEPLRLWPALQDDETRRAVGWTTREFARSVQGIAPTRSFHVGDQVSVFVAETRLQRTETKFMRDVDLAAVEAWIANLESPGVLVLGQPLLWEPFGSVEAPDAPSAWNWALAALGAIVGGIPGAIAGALAPEAAEEIAAELAGDIADHNLMFYKAQYRRLVHALSRSRHDVLVLSGDIHLGRIARFRIHRTDGEDPTKVYEVIASPMSLLDTGPIPRLDTRASMNYPRWFPSDLRLREPGVIPAVVDYPRHIPENEGGRPQDHMMTLSFTAGPEPGSVRVEVRAWLIQRGGGEPPVALAWRRPYTFTLDGGRLPRDGSRPDRVVTHTITNPDGDIMALANPRASWSPRLRNEVMRDLDEGRARYFTNPDMTGEARIHVVRDRVRGIAYLRTNADRHSGNNLDNLPRLPWGEWHD